MSTTKESNPQGINWTKEMENILFKAMSRKRPIWIHAHFSMASIVKIFNKESKLKATADDIWTKLKVMYRLDDINRNQVMELPASFRERKDFVLEDYPQFKEKIESPSASVPKEENKNKIDVAIVENSSIQITKKAIVRRPRKPKILSLEPPTAINIDVNPKSIQIPISKKPRKPRKTALNQQSATIPVSIPTPKKPRKSRKINVNLETFSIPKSTPKTSRKSQKVEMSLEPVSFPAPNTTSKKPRKSRKIDANPGPVSIPALPVISVTPKKRGRPFKKPIDTLSESPIPPVKKRRYKVTITK